ncbi:MAG TPA: GNAT family N-acetyltransferase [Rubrobacter sp.]|nr:GNAT family N-acetyltransferase [Rubrobacter sp.]
MVGSDGTAGKSIVNVEIRDATFSDAKAIADIFYHTVLNVNVRDYSRTQVEAWAGAAPDPEKWQRRIAAVQSSRQTFVAVHGGQVLGFAEFEGDGHIDTLYVHHDFQDCGIATRLLEKIEAEAQRRCLARLYTEASITARPFFERRGFSVVTPQSVEVRGQTFRNYRMEKTGHPGEPGENA